MPDLPIPRLLIVPERFQRYLTACGGDVAKAEALIEWNADITEAFTGPLATMELCLRNSLDIVLRTDAGRDDWWIRYPVWSSQEKMLNNALDSMARLKGPGYTHGDVVAELSLGFWTGLTSHRYRTRWKVHAKAFPHYTGERAPLFERLDFLRLFRNRTAHLESIYYRDLAADHRSVVKVLGWIDPVAADYATAKSRFDEVFARRPNR